MTSIVGLFVLPTEHWIRRWTGTMFEFLKLFSTQARRLLLET